MAKEEFNIEITATGEVKITFKDVAGAHVVEYVELLTRMVGKMQDEKIDLHSRRYKPDPKVGIHPVDESQIHKKM
jgi:hypothetical protein